MDIIYIIAPINPSSKIIVILSEVATPTSRTMTGTVSYASSDGTADCQSVIGGYVVQAYPYYLAGATLTSVTSG